MGTALSSSHSYTGGSRGHTRRCHSHPRPQPIGSRITLIQAGPIKSLPWEFGLGLSVNREKERAILGFWVCVYVGTCTYKTRCCAEKNGVGPHQGADERGGGERQALWT